MQENHESAAIVAQVWNPGNTTPAVPGLYVRNHGGTFIAPNPEPLPLFSRWDGEQWYGGYVTLPPACMTQRPASSRLQALPWREPTALELAGDLIKGVPA